MSVLRIVRTPSAADQARGYKVILDGKNVGEVANGHTKTLAVNPGKHELSLKVDWRGSNTLAVTVGKDETVQVAIGHRYAASNFLANLWCLLVAWSSYLLLELRAAGLDAPATPVPPKKQRQTAAKPTEAPAAEPAPATASTASTASAPAAAQEASPPPAAPQDALQRMVADKKKDDPLFGLKVSAKEVVVQLINGMKTDKGIHIQSLLTAIGALAGYACQVSVREEWVNSGKLPENQAFVIAAGADGRQYYFGNLVNKPLAETPYSVWSLAAGGAQQAGGTALPDVAAIFKHVASTVGGDQFGIPNVPPQHKASDLPINYVKNLWPTLQPLVAQFADSPADWPVVTAIAAQQIVAMSKNVIDPGLAVTIVMESAVPMSKVWLGAE